MPIRFGQMTLRTSELLPGTAQASLDPLPLGIPLPKPHRRLWRLDTSALDPRLDKFSKSNPVRRTFAKMRPTTSGVKLHTQLRG